MSRRLLITGLLCISVISIIIILLRMDDLSSDYNYVSAKIDIKNGDIKIINIGIPKTSSEDKEIEKVASRYGFRNIYIKTFSPKQTKKGINNYNRMMEAYLEIRNGSDWKANYEKEIDSLYKVQNP